jgi:hypothetical protein
MRRRQVILILLTLINTIVLIGFGAFVYRDGVHPPPSGWNPLDLVMIMLTAATVVLAGVAVIVAIAAIFGYAFLRDEAIRQANRVSRRAAQRYLSQSLDTEGRLMDRSAPRARRAGVPVRGGVADEEER